MDLYSCLFSWFSISISYSEMWNFFFLMVFWQVEIFNIGQKMSVRFSLLEAQLTILSSSCSLLCSRSADTDFRIMTSKHHEIHLCSIFISQSACIISLRLPNNASSSAAAATPHSLMRKSSLRRNSVTLSQGHIMSKGEAWLKNKQTATTTKQVFWVIPSFIQLFYQILMCAFHVYRGYSGKKSHSRSLLFKNFYFIKFFGFLK